jgi:FkbM family methyltransferase
MVVFDIGAHVGFYSLLAAVLVSPGGKVYAFEPFGPNVEKLRQHVVMNRAAVEVIESAVADRNGTARFERGTDTYTGRLSRQGVEVRTSSIDTMCRAGVLPSPNIIKIDVEGAESLVMRGALETIRSAGPILFLAVHNAAARNECLHLLDVLDYSADAITGAGIETGSEFVARPRQVARAGPGPLP